MILQTRFYRFCSRVELTLFPGESFFEIGAWIRKKGKKSEFYGIFKRIILETKIYFQLFYADKFKSKQS